MPNTTQEQATRDKVIHLDELAKVLGKTAHYLKQNHRKLVEKTGMPPKHPAGWIWSRVQIDVWLTSQGYVSAVPDNDNDGGIPEEVHKTRVEDQTAALLKGLGVTS